MTTITNYLKKCETAWSSATVKVFVKIKARMVSALVMYLLDFFKNFDVACDTSGTGICEVLAQEKYPIACFSEKVNDVKQKYLSMIRSSTR